MKTHDQRLADLYYFAKEDLGYRELTHLHLSWLNALLQHRFLLLLAPPKHFKSSVCTMAYPLFRLTEDNNMRILLVNEVLDNSKGFLREIKGHLTQNERFRERYGHWDLAADAWTEDRILIPRTEIRKEPSIAVASVLGTVVSIHPNLIVLDDPCSNRNTLTPSSRLKVINWFQRDLLPRLDHGGQIIIVMTRWHTDDLAGWIMTHAGYEDWKIISLGAEWTDDKNQHHVLFPERFTKESLEKEKKRLGTANYNCIYLNDPSGQEGSDFKAAWIDSGRYDRPPEGLTVYAGIDLAITSNERSSSFAYCVIGKDAAGVIYVIDAYRDKILFVEQLMAVKRLKKHHDPSAIMIETNAYQAAFPEALRMDEETRRLPIFTKSSTGDKQARLRGLAPLFQRGDIRLPRSPNMGVSLLEDELLHFPHGSNDLLDALWLAVQALEKRRIESKIRYAGDSPHQPAFNGLTPGLWPEEIWRP